MILYHSLCFFLQEVRKRLMKLENERKTDDKYSLSINNIIADITHNYFFLSFYGTIYEKRLKSGRKKDVVSIRYDIFFLV